MMQINSLTQTQSYSPTMSFKIDSSLGTQANSQMLKKKVSLSICSSSVSLDQMLQYSKQKELFAKYLMADGFEKQTKIFEEMRNIYQSSQFLIQEENQSNLDLSKGSRDQRGNTLTYFIKIWLKHIGYGTPKNKQYVLNRAKIFLGPKALPQLKKIYLNLNLLPMEIDEKIRFLKQVCRSGWQYFIQELAKQRILIWQVQQRVKINHIFFQKN